MARRVELWVSVGRSLISADKVSMASNLRQRLKIAGRGLAETSAEELATLTGRTAAPTSPLETGVIGGTDDQAKMAGTPAQKISALRTTLQGDQQDLSTRLRREQVRRKATEEEAAALGGVERLQQLGDLESRVEQLAEKALLTGATAGQEVKLRAEGEEAAVDLLNRIRDNPNDVEAIKAFNNLMGRTQVADMFNSQDILSNFDVSIDPATGQAKLGGRGLEEVAGALAESVQDKITSGELNFEEMGFSGIDEVASLLGTDSNNLQGMSVQGMLDQLNAQIADEYSTVEDLQRRANDISLGASERAEARKLLREMGAVGIRSAELDIDKLADEIEEANKVEFMGEEMTTEELLDNDYISGLVLNYFQRPDFAEQLQDEEPELVDFIKKHETMLLDSVAEVDQRLADFSRLQNENLNLQKTSVGEIDDDIMREWIPGFGEITTDRYQSNPVINYLKSDSQSSKNKEHLMGSLNMLQTKAGAETIKELGQLDINTIQSLGLTDHNSDAYKRTETYYDVANKVQNLDVNNTDAVAQTLGAENENDLRTVLSESEKKERSGLFGENNKNEELREIVKDGETMTQAGQRLKDLYLPGGDKISLRQLVNSTPPNYTDDFTEVKNFSEQDNKVYNLVENAFTNDDRIDLNELRKINNETDLEGLNLLYKNDVIKAKADDAFKSEMLTYGVGKYNSRSKELKNIAKLDETNYLDEDYWTNEVNYSDQVKKSDQYIAALNDERKIAEANGDKLTVDVINKYIKAESEKKSEFKDKHDEYVKAERQKTLQANLDELRRNAERLGLPQVLETVKKTAGFIQDPGKTTLEELARWDEDIKTELANVEKSIRKPAAALEAGLRTRLVEPVVDVLPGAKGIRKIGQVVSDLDKGIAGGLSSIGKGLGGLTANTSKSVQSAVKKIFSF